MTATSRSTAATSLRESAESAWRAWALAAQLACALVAAACVSSCTRPNPDFCCVTEADCAAQGVGELRTCASDQVCDGNACHGIQCATAAECGDATAPYCVAQLCKAACTGDQDCAGATGPLCASDGVCVGCERNADCPAAAPVCDPARRACAPCRADADCASGVCLAADGVCAMATELIYVSNDGVDGACTKNMPCKTFGYAFNQVNSIRRVIRLLGAFYDTTDGISISSKEVYIDGENTEVRRSTDGILFTLTGTSQVTVEGIKMLIPPGRKGVSITSDRLTRLSQIDASGSSFQLAAFTDAGALRISDSKLVVAGILCGRASLELARNSFTSLTIEGGDDCAIHARQNVLSDVQVNGGGVLQANNNLVLSTSATCTNELHASVTSIQFNTFACRHTPPISSGATGYAAHCGPNTELSNNIFAWDSTAPLFGVGCSAHHNLFLPFSTTTGADNIIAESSSLFVNLIGGNYHLSPTSAARGAGEPRTGVLIDLEGNPRPNPAGSNPDIGAFEAP